MNFYRLLLWLFMPVFLFACATAGQKYISLQYTQPAVETEKGDIGISDFEDNRPDVPKGYIGRRVLLDNSQETYFVNSMDLAASLTQAVASFLETRGFKPVPVMAWDATPDGVAAVSNPPPYLVGGTVQSFECRAQKKGGHTTMTLDIGFDLFLGIPAKQAVKTMPVSFSLEKTVLTFTREKFEGFVNDSIAEILEKALIIED